jgi:hypothetical protein
MPSRQAAPQVSSCCPVLSACWLPVLPGHRVDPGEEGVEAGGEPLVAVVGPDVLAEGGDGGEALGWQGPEEGVELVAGRGILDARGVACSSPGRGQS